MSPSTPAGLVIVAALYRAVYRDTITGSDPTDLYRQLRDQPEAAFFPVQTMGLLRADMQATWLVSVMSAGSNRRLALQPVHRPRDGSQLVPVDATGRGRGISVSDEAKAGTRLSALAIFGSLLSTLAATIVNDSLSATASELHVSVADVASVIIGYLLTMALSLPLSGGLVERFGVRQVYLPSTTTRSGSGSPP